jgi:cystathionine beta-synthase
MKFASILETVGNTPLIRLNKLTQGIPCPVYAKVEYFNPGGSVKDRIGISMMREAEKRGSIKPGGTIIECTSGNTGMGLALYACVKGYKAIFTVNDKQSQEKINMLKAMGAEVIVCPTAVPPGDPRHYVEVAKKLEQEIPNSLLLNQYDNPDNPLAHYQTTGPELWRDTEGKITHFVCGMGTCGTISGTGRYLKQQDPKVQVIGVDPVGSLFYEFKKTGRVGEAHVYKVEGVGEDFFPGALDWSVVDNVVQVTDKESFLMTRKLARAEGIFAGGSSGMAIVGALHVARTLSENDLLVVLLPDGGMRNLNKVYNDEWMRENQFLEAEIRLSCRDILRRKKIKDLVFVRPSDTAVEAIKTMRGGDISQVPVFDNGLVVGTLHEDDVISMALQGKDLGGFIVREIMRDPLPIITQDATLEEITRHIPGEHPALLVDVGGGRFDIITKYDLVSTVGQLAVG